MMSTEGNKLLLTFDKCRMNEIPVVLDAWTVSVKRSTLFVCSYIHYMVGDANTTPKGTRLE